MYVCVVLQCSRLLAPFLLPPSPTNLAQQTLGPARCPVLLLPAGKVTFWVNGELAGEVPWALGAAAHPSISCEQGGGVQCDITMDGDSG